MFGLAKYDREVKFVSLILILSYFLSPILVKLFSPFLSVVPSLYGQVISNAFTTWVPACVAFAFTFINMGPEGVDKLFKQFKPRRAHLFVYFTVPCLALFILGAALLIVNADAVVIWQHLSSNILTFVILLLLQVVFVALGEEIGWRGYLQSNLLRKCSKNKTALYVFLAWTIWHWPKYTMLSYEGSAALTLSLLSFSYLFVYTRSWFRPYLLIFAIVHGSFNASIYFFEPVLGETMVSVWLVTAAIYGVATLAIVFQDSINKNSSGNSSPYGHY